MKCLVLSFLMGYNGQVYKKGEYVEVTDEESIKRLVQEHCISRLPLVEVERTEKEEVEYPSSSSILNADQKAVEEKAEEERQIKKAGVKKQVIIAKRGAKK